MILFWTYIFRTSTPVLLSNAHYGQGNTSRVIGDLGCAGWEDHIGQCNIIERGSCLHTEDAGVRCIGTLHNLNEKKLSATVFFVILNDSNNHAC